MRKLCVAMQAVDMIELMPAKNRKDDGIFIRLTPKEKKALQAAANQDERTIADWTRRLFRQRFRELGLLPEEDKPKTKEQ
jgi:hypothetical protein